MSLCKELSDRQHVACSPDSNPQPYMASESHCELRMFALYLLIGGLGWTYNKRCKGFVIINKAEHSCSHRDLTLDAHTSVKCRINVANRATTGPMTGEGLASFQF
jgi:hypothetical protein